MTCTERDLWYPRYILLIACSKVIGPSAVVKISSTFHNFENWRKHCKGSHKSTHNWHVNYVGIQQTVFNTLKFSLAVRPRSQTTGICLRVDPFLLFFSSWTSLSSWILMYSKWRITKHSNWTPAIGDPCDRGPIVWQVGVPRTNHDHEFCYRYYYCYHHHLYYYNSVYLASNQYLAGSTDLTCFRGLSNVFILGKFELQSVLSFFSLVVLAVFLACCYSTY